MLHSVDIRGVLPLLQPSSETFLTSCLVRLKRTCICNTDKHKNRLGLLQLVDPGRNTEQISPYMDRLNILYLPGYSSFVVLDRTIDFAWTSNPPRGLFGRRNVQVSKTPRSRQSHASKVPAYPHFNTCTEGHTLGRALSTP